MDLRFFGTGGFEQCGYIYTVQYAVLFPVRDPAFFALCIAGLGAEAAASGIQRNRDGGENLLYDLPDSGLRIYSRNLL